MLGILGESALFSGGTAMESRGTHRPYGPPPGLLGLIYGLSSGQEIPHFPSLGLFCNGKLHHLPNLRNISMGEILEDWTHQLKVSLLWPSLKNPVCFGLIQLNSDHFKGESWFITVVQDLISKSRGLQFPDTLLSMMIYTALVGINGKFLFSWVQLSLISPLQPPAVLTMPVKQNCSMILPPSNT